MSKSSSQKNYSNLRAMLGIMRASLRSSLRNPASIIFGLIFPLIFIVVFGYIGGGSGEIKVAVDKNTDQESPIYQALTKIGSIKLNTDLEEKDINEGLSKGKLDGLINIKKEDPAAPGMPPKYQTELTTTNASPQSGQVLTSIVSGITDKVNLSAVPNRVLMATLTTQERAGRKLNNIDFILPGQLGFSLLTAGIFATAFVLLTLKQTLVIKRFFTTPINRLAIIIGEGLSRLIFAVMQGGVLVLVGHFAFGYTLIYGLWTFLAIMALSALGLTVFLGFGFIISSVAKDERTVPPMAQLVTLPQFLLAGTFFPIETFPTWLQPISRVLPLTYFNDAVRKVAFEGVGLSGILPEVGALLIWGVIVYTVAVLVFKWD